MKSLIVDAELSFFAWRELFGHLEDTSTQIGNVFTKKVSKRVLKYLIQKPNRLELPITRVQCLAFSLIKYYPFSRGQGILLNYCHTLGRLAHA